MPSDPAVIARQWAGFVKRQPRLTLASYPCALLGALLAVHDYHPNRFGFSTIFLGAAILLYLLGQKRTGKRPPTRPKR